MLCKASSKKNLDPNLLVGLHPRHTLNETFCSREPWATKFLSIRSLTNLTRHVVERRWSGAIDPFLCHHQAGGRCGASCADRDKMIIPYISYSSHLQRMWICCSNNATTIRILCPIEWRHTTQLSQSLFKSALSSHNLENFEFQELNVHHSFSWNTDSTDNPTAACSNVYTNALDCFHPPKVARILPLQLTLKFCILVKMIAYCSLGSPQYTTDFSVNFTMKPPPKAGIFGAKLLFSALFIYF